MPFFADLISSFAELIKTVVQKMKSRAAFILVTSAVLSSCSVTHDKAWNSPDRTTELRFVKGPQGPTYSNEDSFSFYSLHESQSGKRLITVRSIINEYTHPSVQKQRIHFSPTGRTILIEEDISDASPDYVYTLIYRGENGFYSRDLALPGRSSSNPHDVYGLWPDVLSITDDSIEYRFFEDEQSAWVKITDLRDRGF